MLQELAVEVERVKPGFVGIMPGGVSAEEAAALGLAAGVGVRVQGLVPGGPAMEAGLEPLDVIAGIGGKPVGTGTLGRVLQALGAGEAVEVLVYRGGEPTTLTMVLGERS